MSSLRWKKLLRDLWQARGRTIIMVIVIAVSIFGFGTVLNSYSILYREVSRNYLVTNPASATLSIHGDVDDVTLAAIRNQPDIADAQMRATVFAQAEVAPGQWRTLILFVVDDFNDMRLSTFQHVSGAWPPPIGTMLIEQTAPGVLNASTGQNIMVKTPNGSPRSVPITGLVHDTGLAPAWQEQEGYGYITPATLAWLGESAQLNDLKILVSAQPDNAAAINRTAQHLAAWLQSQGYQVDEIQIPPPREYPHQKQVNSLQLLLVAFSLVALLLSAILAASMVNGLISRQIRQVGAMKAVGARMSQIATLYFVLVVLISSVAVVIALPLSIRAGIAFASTITSSLNMTLGSSAIPWWSFAAQVGVGLLIPLLAATGPIVRGSRITVREAISDYGVRQETLIGRTAAVRLRLLRSANRITMLALRNTFRRQARIVLTFCLLAVGGATFISGLNVAASWNQTIADGLAAHQYNIEVRLNHLESDAYLTGLIRNIPGVQQVEAWNSAPTTPTNPRGVDVVQTYPDGGHGSFAMIAPPDGTALIQFPVLAGRWLKSDDTDAVVLNQGVHAFLPDVNVGDRIALSTAGRSTTWLVVGIVQEFGAQATAYVSNYAFTHTIGELGAANMLRVAVAGSDPAARAQTLRMIESTLIDSGVSVSKFMTDSDLRSALDGHFISIIGVLIVMAILMAVVGLLGLTSAMSTNVVERTREFGIMKAIGGTRATILRVVVSEGTIIGFLSGIIAIALAFPLSLLGDRMSTQFIYVPLPFVIAPYSVVLWLAVVLAGAALASVIPAWRAAQIPVRETLAYA
ncbi:MAG TPA: FtsX-like permease family protein [Ktedonobacterales bacterium]